MASLFQSIMDYDGFHGISWYFTMIYFTCFKTPWYAMAFTIAYFHNSWASQSRLIQVFPSILVYSSTVFLQVPSGLPLFLFPCRWCPFESGVWNIIPVHAENMTRSSPSSLLHLIYDVVDVGAFCDFSLCYLLL